MESVAPEPLISRNPATGAELARIATTRPADVATLVARARHEAIAWSRLGLPKRLEPIRQLWAILARDAEVMAGAVRDEIGKPYSEALIEVTATLDVLRWTVKYARHALAERRISPGWQRFGLMKGAWLIWPPLGVIGIIGTWNYPLFLDVSAIVHALVAGNGVVWKPSELSGGVASLLRDRLERVDLPPGLVATVFGEAEVGRAVVASDIDKGVFTGGVTNGRLVMTALAERGIPSAMELSGFDPAIVLPDAPMEATVRALTWGAFVGAGQTCVSVKRVYVVGDARPWAEALADGAKALRVGDPSAGDVDMGPLISPSARDRFHNTVRAAIDAGARCLAGGDVIDGPGSFHQPTVLLSEDRGPEDRLAGAFGPVVIVRAVKSPQEAVEAANGTLFGLSASVWGADRRLARAVARHVQAGMVTINDAVTPTGLAAAPFGGVKGSGFGRMRGELGLHEFVSPMTVHERGPGGWRPQLFPYSPSLASVLALYRSLFHRG